MKLLLDENLSRRIVGLDRRSGRRAHRVRRAHPCHRDAVAPLRQVRAAHPTPPGAGRPGPESKASALDVQTKAEAVDSRRWPLEVEALAGPACRHRGLLFDLSGAATG